MGSNPILAASDQRKRGSPARAGWRLAAANRLTSTILLPSGRRPAPDGPGPGRIKRRLTAAHPQPGQGAPRTRQPLRQWRRCQADTGARPACRSPAPPAVVAPPKGQSLADLLGAQPLSSAIVVGPTTTVR